MLFPTFTFILFFLPVTVLLYFLLSGKYPAIARWFLVAASFVFYSWFNWSYSLILAGTLVMNWFFANLLYMRKSRWILALGILCNVLLLGYFKYYDFFIENINAVFGTSFVLKHILLPLGISFFTFQQISFLQLVYSGGLAKRYSFGSYALFVCFFPQLIAGPIVLPDEMMSQFDDRKNSVFNASNAAAGLYLFALGLGKKILLADFFAEIADPGFSAVSCNFFEAWKTVLAYTFQIYFDFSGYCDMATGIGLIFNIALPQNFNAPYRSLSITDFWRRWHITLGRFLMHGIYIPLGGNRHGSFRTCCNLWIVFLVSGIWHGAGWMFVLWGVMHGAALSLHRVWSKFGKWQMPAIPAQILTFLFVALAWVPFRAECTQTTMKIYRAIFMPQSFAFRMPDMFQMILFGIAFILILFFPTAYDMGKKFRPTWINALVTIALFVASMFLFVKVSPFIYFNF